MFLNAKFNRFNKLSFPRGIFFTVSLLYQTNNCIVFNDVIVDQKRTVAVEHPKYSSDINFSPRCRVTVVMQHAEVCSTSESGVAQSTKQKAQLRLHPSLLSPPSLPTRGCGWVELKEGLRRVWGCTLLILWLLSRRARNHCGSEDKNPKFMMI